MISYDNIAAAIFWLAISWFGGRFWLRIIFPEIREVLALIFLPPVITGAVLIVSLMILDRVRIPINFWSVTAVITLNLLIPLVLSRGHRFKPKKGGS